MSRLMSLEQVRAIESLWAEATAKLAVVLVGLDMSPKVVGSFIRLAAHETDVFVALVGHLTCWLWTENLTKDEIRFRRTLLSFIACLFTLVYWNSECGDVGSRSAGESLSTR